jgi:spore germination protein
MPRARLVWPVVALLAVGAVVVTMVVIGGPAPRRTLIVSSMPYWNIGQSTSVVLANRSAFSEASPWMYGLASDGQITTQYVPDQSAAVARDLRQLRAKGLRIVPTIANITGGRWSYQPVARMLHSPTLRDEQVAAIVALVVGHNYAGIDIDYENLQADDRQVFTTFVARLAAALHAENRILSVALFAKTTDAGYAPRNVAQDYAAIGRVVDQMRLMAYDYHWAGSAPGPVAPVSWISAVLRYAKTQMPASKIVLGVPLYGYNWSDGQGSGLSWRQASQLAVQHHATVRYDTTAQAPWLSYTDSSGHMHTVWFENAASSKAKFALARQAGIAGVYLWMFGSADTGTWRALRHVLPTSGPSALTTSKAVQ